MYHILHLPYPSNIFHYKHGGKILGISQQWAKIKIIGGMYPPRFAALCLAASWCSALGVSSDYRALCSDGTKCCLPSDRRDGRYSDRNVSC